MARHEFIDGETLTAENLENAFLSVEFESLGSQTVGTSQVTIAHGLSYTPTIVLVTMTSAGTIWRSSASTSANIFLTADAAARTAEVWVR